MAASADKKRTKVWDYSGAYTEFGLASPHAWDRVNCIAGEYARGEISWSQAKVWLDETKADVAKAAEQEDGE